MRFVSDKQRKAVMARLTSNQAVADAFAHGATKGGVRHLFIEGDTIYSYGHHFPIARRLDNNQAIFYKTRIFHDYGLS